MDSYEANETKDTMNKLQSGNTYYFRVRAFKNTTNGTVYSSWSPVKSVIIK